MKPGAAHNRLRRRYISLLLVVGLLLYISSQNTQTVTVNFLFWSTSLSLILLLYLTFIFGVVSGLFFKGINSYLSERIEKKMIKDKESADAAVPAKKSLLKVFSKKNK